MTIIQLLNIHAGRDRLCTFGLSAVYAGLTTFPILPICYEQSCYQNQNRLATLLYTVYNITCNGSSWEPVSEIYCEQEFYF